MGDIQLDTRQKHCESLKPHSVPLMAMHVKYVLQLGGLAASEHLYGTCTYILGRQVFKPKKKGHSSPKLFIYSDNTLIQYMHILFLLTQST